MRVCRARCSGRRGSSRGCFDEQRDFAADAVAGGEFAADFGDAPAQKLFVNLGQLARNCDAQLRTKNRFEIGKRIEQAVRRFVKDQCARSFALAWAARFSSFVRRAPAFSGRNPRNSNSSAGRPEAISALTAALAPGMGKTGTPAAMASRTSHEPGSLTPGRSRVRHERDGLPGLYVLDQFRGTGAFVVLVATDGFFLDLEMIEKFLGLARVFAGDAIDGAQNIERAQRDVAKIADGSGDEVEAGGEGLLAAGRSMLS